MIFTVLILSLKIVLVRRNISERGVDVKNYFGSFWWLKINAPGLP